MVRVFLGIGDGTFDAPTDFPVGDSPTKLTAADFDMDGKLDLAVSNSVSRNVSVLMGDGAGSFSAAVNFPDPVDLGVLNGGAEIMAGDLNGDGKPDLAVVSGGTDTVAVFLNTTPPPVPPFNFGAPTGGQSFQHPYNAAMGDFNGDGNLDVLAGDNSQQLRLLLGNGAGGLGSTINTSFSGPCPGATCVQGTRDVLAGDVNNDGKLDIVVAGFASFGVTLGTGDGTFGAENTYAMGSDTRSAAVADLNNDGNLDILGGNAQGNTTFVHVRLGNGDGTFGAATAYVDGGITRVSMKVVDVNGDGNLDVLTANVHSANISVFTGDGTGALFAASLVPIAGAVGIEVVDFNGDGNPDIAAVRGGTPSSRLRKKGKAYRRGGWSVK